ncbi:MAG TPA: hypothetical protein PLC18_13630 [Sediminibacterium sp.]|uniref:hypothetical protein n=1 Tax=Sediminibacterium sp. TaxID=1917865 RepID=UPI000BD45E8E|nr:hypothetical protein [Sediminibacterium sp.]MBT9484387.1 hypothetical protein [Sediminibacterium sp.]OZA61827.1 MAG: hypothetical protein B7X72_13400 [Sphingobacteriia bacterium 39-39-8]HQS25134.1 hypothetical protein [Sediminibacterium sp.]HQS36451.1 hypothetical protein [Sediminibacterium sp.]
MTEFTQESLDKKSILKQVFIALIVGALLLVCAVLPAEYGIDVLGVGKFTGFSKLYVSDTTKNSTSLPKTLHKILKIENVGSGLNVPKPLSANNPSPKIQYADRTDEISVVIPAGKGLEYKVNMLKYGQLKYEWITDRGELYFDFHGEVKGNSNYFESYAIAYSNNMAGSLVAPFEGPHGWYFKNNSEVDMTVKIRMIGQYMLKK